MIALGVYASESLAFRRLLVVDIAHGICKALQRIDQSSWRHRLEEWYGVRRDAVFGITNALVVCDCRCRERA